MNSKFVEIEHKYLVNGDFDLEAFRQCARALGPIDSTELLVTDTYHVASAVPGHVIRHRIDNELQQLTIKSSGGGTELRTEVNLELDLQAGDQAAVVKAFLEPMGLLWSGMIEKNIVVFYFPNCEVVYYRASSDRGQTHHCVEFEAKNPTSLEQGLAVIAQFEAAFGFSSEQRCPKSLFELMFEREISPQVKDVLFAGGLA